MTEVIIKRSRGRPPKGTPRPLPIPQEEYDSLPPLLNQHILKKNKEDLSYAGLENNSKTQYIGRDEKDPKGRGKWGNPFAIGKFYGDREEVVERHEKWLKMQLVHPTKGPELLNQIRTELKGKSLICWCVNEKAKIGPESCHGNILRILANCKDPEAVISKMRGG
jgi:hypothetical protein